jgi:hypothetical protein
MLLFVVTDLHMFVAAIMEDFQEISRVIFAFLFSVGQVKQLQHFDENVKALRDDSLLQLRVEEELLKYTDGDYREVTVAEGD